MGSEACHHCGVPVLAITVDPGQSVLLEPLPEPRVVLTTAGAGVEVAAYELHTCRLGPART